MKQSFNFPSKTHVGDKMEGVLAKENREELRFSRLQSELVYTSGEEVGIYSGCLCISRETGLYLPREGTGFYLQVLIGETILALVKCLFCFLKLFQRSDQLEVSIHRSHGDGPKSSQ